MLRQKILRDSLANIQYLKTLNTEQSIIRSFSINKFGIYNCDRIFKDADKQIVKPVFMVGDTIITNCVYLLDLTEKAVVALYPGSDLHFNKSSKNILMTVISENKFAVLRNEEFIQNTLNTTKNVIHLNLVKKTVSSIQNFYEYFKSDLKE